MMCTAAGMASTGMASLPSPPKADLRKADLLASRPFVADMARLAEGLVMQVYSSSHAYYYYPTTHLHEMLRRDGIEPEGNFGLRSTRHDVSVVHDLMPSTRHDVCSQSDMHLLQPTSYRTACCRPPPTTYLPSTYQDMHRAFWDFDATSSVASVQAGP